MPNAEDARFDALAERVFRRTVRRFPVYATYLGIHDYDDQLGDYSAQAFEDDARTARADLQELGTFSPERLGPDRAVDLRLLRAVLEDTLADFEAGPAYRRHPALYADAGLGGCYLLMTRDFAPLETRMAAVRARLEQVPGVLEHGRKNLQSPPRVFTENAIAGARGGVAFFRELVPAMAARCSAGLREAVLAANGRAVAAMEEHVRFLETDLLPRSTGRFAIGRDRFDRKLKAFHLLDYDADSLAATGWRLIEETRAQLKALADRVDPGRTWEELVAEAKRAHPAAGEVLDAYRRAMDETRRFVVERSLVDLVPGEELEVEETPVFLRPFIPYAAYQSPAPFESRQRGTFYVTPVDRSAPPEVQQQQLEGHSTYGIPITALHEGYPGHHTQLCWANRNPSKVRQLGFSTVFCEGWAFYCEELMEELGYIDDPRARLLRLKDQLWRACRIVIDAGLHTGGMSFDDAVNMLVDVARLERVNAEAEVRRYTFTPTQPMSYLIGKLEILKLADEYRRRKGDAFSLRQFHHDLLAHGTIPPALVRELLFTA